MAALVRQFVSLNINFNFKFKDRELWNFEEPYQWSSQPITAENVQSILWNENGEGKTVRVELITAYVPHFGYDYKVYSNGNLENVTFAAGAFENSERLPRRPAVQIYIFGETNHTHARPQSEQLKQYFLGKGFFVLGEGLNMSPNQEDLDEPYSELRSSILLASLSSKFSKFGDKTQKLLKILNLLISMLEIEKPLPADIQPLQGDLQLLNKEQRISDRLKRYVETHAFDFNRIYGYYFPLDDYTDDMTTLLNLNDEQATLLYVSQSETYMAQFTRIMQDAREDKMIERIRLRAQTHRVAVFTGIKHVPKLKEILSSDYFIQNYTLPSSEYQFQQMLKAN